MAASVQFVSGQKAKEFEGAVATRLLVIQKRLHTEAMERCENQNKKVKARLEQSMQKIRNDWNEKSCDWSDKSKSAADRYWDRAAKPMLEIAEAFNPGIKNCSEAVTTTPAEFNHELPAVNLHCPKSSLCELCAKLPKEMINNGCSNKKRVSSSACLELQELINKENERFVRKAVIIPLTVTIAITLTIDVTLTLTLIPPSPSPSPPPSPPPSPSHHRPHPHLHPHPHP